MLDHHALRDLLPHRHPTLLVDRVVDCVPGESIHSIKAVSGAEPCYADVARCAGDAYPDALVLESWVQSAAVLWAITRRTQADPPTGTLVFAQTRRVEFHAVARPGDLIHHSARICRIEGDRALFEGVAFLPEQRRLLTVGTVALALLDRDRLHASTGR